MRRTSQLLTTLAAVVVLTGCAGVPNWVEKEAGAFSGEWGDAIYAVGIAAPDPNPQAQRALAKLNARTEISRIQQIYVAELLKSFVRAHKDYFNIDTASSVQLFEQAGRQVTESTQFGSRVIDTWVDKSGAIGPKDTLYVLMKLDLNGEFFTAAQEQYKAAIREHQAKVLKVEAAKAFEELDKELEKARKSPFGFRAPEME